MHGNVAYSILFSMVLKLNADELFFNKEITSATVQVWSFWQNMAELRVKRKYIGI